MVRLIALLLLLLTSAAQITPSSNTTLLELANALASKGTLSSRAVGFLIQIHPELSNYTVASMT